MTRCLWLVALGVAGIATGASAAPAPVEGIVVAVEEGEVIIDLGQARGLPSGARVDLYRRMVVKHPISGKEIEDRFPIGVVVPAQVGTLLSIVRDTSALERPPVPGDFAVWLPSAPEPKPPAPKPPVAAAPDPAAPAAPPVAQRPADDVALEATFAESLGKPLERRIELFVAFVAAFPDSPHVDRVGHEVVTLRALQKQTRTAAEPAPGPAEPDPDALTVRHAKPRPIIQGQRFEVAIALIESDQVTEVRLLAARDPERTWQSVPMARDGDYYYRADVPTGVLAEPGDVLYVVEAVRPDGRLQPVVGDYDKPIRLRVDPLPPGAAPPGATRLDVRARFVDFNTAGDAIDQYFQFDSTLSYAIDFGVLQAVRVGVGVIDGEGGPTEAIDAGAPSRPISLNYAFAEAELGLGAWVGLAGRVIGGNQQGASDTPRNAMTGIEARLRVGRFDETRFVAGVSVLDVLGAQGFLDAHIEVFERVPMRLGVVVTNLPVDEDLGVQIEYQAGLKVLDWLTLVGEVGWNARTINHYGFTGGGGLSLSW